MALPTLYSNSTSTRLKLYYLSTPAGGSGIVRRGQGQGHSRESRHESTRVTSRCSACEGAFLPPPHRLQPILAQHYIRGVAVGLVGGWARERERHTDLHRLPLGRVRRAARIIDGAMEDPGGRGALTGVP
eukprot:scaffold1792_cov124-Isochrysis_galbana.AAC.4